MFERYTEKARRVIFFARYEASQFGSPYIETEHLLLGLLREDKALTNRFLRSLVPFESVRKQIESQTTIREKTSTSVDLPLSNECKRILAYAAEEAERLHHKHIGAEHLLLGLLREEDSLAGRLLKERGVKLAGIRQELEQTPHDPEPRGVVNPAALSDFGRDLTQAAAEGRLDSLIGREEELEGVVEILCRRHNNSLILIGERGIGKSAIVEGLAQRIANGTVPQPLSAKRIMAIDGQVIAGWTINRRNADERLNQMIKALIDAPDVILFVDDLQLLIAAASSSGSAVVIGILKHWLQRGKMQCIGTCNPADYLQASQLAPWIRDCFQIVHVHPLTQDMTLRVLQSRKDLYETFHGVIFADEALEFAAHASGSYLMESPLPGKALELIDAAASRVKSRQPSPPGEIAESMKRIRVILQQIDGAVVDHEFEKARFYSDEERKERETLRDLRKQHHLDEVPSSQVSRKDVEEVIARWAAYPFRT